MVVARARLFVPGANILPQDDTIDILSNQANVEIYVPFVDKLCYVRSLSPHKSFEYEYGHQVFQSLSI